MFSQHMERATRFFRWPPPATLRLRSSTAASQRHAVDLRAQTRSPFVVASAENVALSRQAHWVYCSLVPGETYRLRSLLEGTSSTADNGALVRFDVTDPQAAGGEGLKMSASVGPCMYLRTGDGTHRTDRIFSVASPAHRFGLMAWGGRGDAVVSTLTIEKADGGDRPTDFFFSFDVEAGAKRAAGDPIDSLVWGKVGGGEYGIRRICDVLEQHRIKGNFLIDFATCTFEGDEATRRIVDFLAERGHEIHLHLHPGGLERSWGLRIDKGMSIQLDGTTYEMSRRLLDFTVSKYERFVGHAPRLFRSGAYRMNANLALAAGAVGIEALSNVRRHTLLDPAIGGDIVATLEPFLWENGVVEIPVDASSPELGSFENYLGKFEAAVKRKSLERTFNIVMHSYSLMRRNEQGVHDAFEPEYEHRLHQMCEHAVRQGRAFGYGEYLDERRVPRPVERLSRIRTAEPEPLVYVASDNIATCNICDLVFARAKMPLDLCPGCGLGSRHRQLKHVVDSFGNVFDNRSVLAHQLPLTARRAFLSGASRVVTMGPGHGSALATHAVARNIRAIKDASYGCFVDLHLLSRTNDVERFAGEIARILGPGGVFVSGEPDLVADTSNSDQQANGSVPSRGEARDYDRRSGLTDCVDLLSNDFLVSSIPGLDPVTNTLSRILFAYKR